MGEQFKIVVPDIGDFEDVDVVEVLVGVGDKVDAEDSLIVLETDKATMEIPAPRAGTIRELRVQVDSKVNEGDLIALLDIEGDADAPADDGGDAEREEPDDASDSAPRARSGDAAEDEADRSQPEPEPAAAREPESPQPSPAGDPADRARTKTAPGAHASPSVRRLARELGVDLSLVPSTGRKGRVLQEDVQGYVKAMVSKGTAAGVPIAGVAVQPAPEIDFGKFGDVETQALNRIRKLSSANLHRSWVTVPHVTQFDEADITELEAFRKSQKAVAEAREVKLTFLPFLMKAIVKALGEFPHFNSSLDRTGENLILKRYFHIGVAVDTDQGLVVPVIRDVDRKDILDLAAELMDVSQRARDRKLRPADLSGGSFTISSLGGIGGTFFTPIVNHPEVAILGVSRMEWKPVYRGDALERRLILPLSLSYDHRVIDGADAVRFTGRLAELLTDLRRVLL